MKRVLITGANRGIGFEFTRRYLQIGDQVIAAVRNPRASVELEELRANNPKSLSIVDLDVTDDQSLSKVFESTKKILDGLDLLINNAGYFPRGESIELLDHSTMVDTIHVNAIAPMMIMKKFLPLLEAGDQPKVVNISSQMGSISRKQNGGSYSYSGSKAALNMFSRLASFECQPKGIIVLAIHPGWVRTDMGGPSAAISTGQSVQGMVSVIDNLTIVDTGKFLTWEGSELPW